MKKVSTDMVQYLEDNNIFLCQGGTIEERATYLSNNLTDKELFTIRISYLESKLSKQK
jgi:hypothetical protein